MSSESNENKIIETCKKLVGNFPNDKRFNDVLEMANNFKTK
jgi:hypothetical protein